MKHVTLEELQNVAVVSEAPRPLTRAERIARWAELLEARGSDRLATLVGTEFEPPAIRARMEAPNSPISVAFADPLLRQDGLTGANYGAARDYFGLSDWQLHEVVCHCHFGASMPASSAARRVRSLAASGDRPTLFSRVRALFGH
jgi:hypothetical protein